MKSKKGWIVILLAVAALPLIAGSTYTQNRRGQGQGMPKYDTATEVTLKGTVTKVEGHVGRMGWNGTHLVVSFGAETLTVHVGPSDYLTQQGFSFAAGDQIEVTGSRINFEGSNVLIAREIKQEDKVLTLRNSQGIPAWSRSRWR
jgi:DNA/RNA endonuclease YhcR with UshA esterase domain